MTRETLRHLGASIDVRDLRRLLGSDAGGQVRRVLLQARDAQLEVADGREVLVESRLVFDTESPAEGRSVLHHGVEHASAQGQRRIDDRLVAGGPEASTEHALEQPHRVGLRRVQAIRSVVRQPGNPRLDPDLERPEAGVAPDLGGHDLVEGRLTERLVLTLNQQAVTGQEPGRTRHVGDRIPRLHLHTGDDRDHVLDGREALELLAELVIDPRRGRDPLLGDDAVAPEEQAKPLGERPARGIGHPVAVEHRVQRGETHGDGGAAEHAAQEGATREMSLLQVVHVVTSARRRCGTWGSSRSRG